MNRRSAKEYLQKRINPNMVDTILSAAGDNSGFQTTLKKIKPYLYYVKYDNLNYSNAFDHFRNKEVNFSGFGCSTIKNGYYFGRNFDWTYDDSAIYVVETPRANGCFATIGVANGGRILLEQTAEQLARDEEYLIMPFKMCDGMNEKGVCVSMNVVPMDNGKTTGTTAQVEERVALDVLMVNRWVLDHCASAQQAVDYLRDYARIYTNDNLAQMDYEVHFMIADADDTFVVEFVDNEVSIVDDVDFMTNFFVSGVEFNDYGSVYTPATKTSDKDAKKTNKITDHGSGLERWNLINQQYFATNTFAGMTNVMKLLNYTKAYSTAEVVSDPYWYSEFTGGDLKVDSDVSAFSNIVAASGEWYLRRSKIPGTDGYGTWWTTHSSVYDISQKKLGITTQEEGSQITFTLGGEN